LILPVELFLGGIGVAIAMAIFGFIRQPQIPAMLVFGGMFVLIIAVATESIIMDSFASGGMQTVYYDVTSTNIASTLFTTTGAEIRGEYLSSSASQLLGDKIDCISVNIAKSAAPTGTATIGVFDGVNLVEASQLKQSFGTIDVSTLTTSSTYNTFCLTGTTYTLVLNDVIGIVYRGGDAVNFITIREDTNNPFDGTITFERRWNDLTQAWISTTANDISAKFYLSSEQVSITDDNYEFTELPKTIFGLMGAIFMLTGALMVARNP